MSNPLVRTLRAYAADARAAFRDAPVEVLLGVTLAVALSVQVRAPSFSEFHFWRLAAALGLAFPLVLALSVLSARGAIGTSVRWMGTAAVLAACGAFGWLGLHEDRDADGWRWMLLAGAAVLALGMTPAIPWRERDRRGGWAFGWRLAVRTVGIGLYAVALFAVLAGAVAAIVSLFELRKPDHVYTDLAGVVFFAFAPWIFVGGIRRLSAPPPADVPEGVSRLGRWLYAPVIVIYLAVLYAYAAKVVATGELPLNLLSPLVIAAGLIGLLGAALLEPVHEDEGHRGLSLLVRAVPALLLPLAALALWALAIRVDAYGWTEFRYVRVAVVVAIGVAGIAGTVRLLLRRRPLQGTLPAVFAAALLLSALGPWSAPAVSRRDQAARLRAELRAAGVDPARLPADSVRVDSAAYERMESGARYLLDAHGIAALRTVIPALPDTTRSVWGMGERLGLHRTGCGPAAWRMSDLAWGGRRAGGMMGGSVGAIDVAAGAPREVPGTGLRASLAGDRLRVEGDGWSAAADLAPLRMRAQGTDGCLPAPDRGAVGQHAPGDALLTLRDASGAARAQVLVTNYAVGRPDPSAPEGGVGEVHVREVRGLLILP